MNPPNKQNKKSAWLTPDCEQSPQSTLVIYASSHKTRLGNEVGLFYSSIIYTMLIAHYFMFKL